VPAAALALGLTAYAACEDTSSDGQGTGETGSETGSHATGSTGSQTGSSQSNGSSAGTAGSTSGTGTGSTTESPDVLCDTLDISLVIDPGAPVLHEAGREAMVTFLDEMVTGSGAEVRVVTNVGTEQMLVTQCLLGLDPDVADGPILVWGRNFEVNPEAADGLGCILDRVASYEGTEDEGDWMFSGLLFPILYDVEQWPTEGSVSLAMLMARADDNLGGMYSRPGMASEAFIRLAGGGDRRYVASFTMGIDADELETFTLSLGDTSLHADFGNQSFEDALSAWTAKALQACDDHDYNPSPGQPAGCEYLDILFVVDGSASMNDEQAARRGTSGEDPVFKEFTDALLLELDTLIDFHVGVISSQTDDTAMHTHTDYPLVPASPDTDCVLPSGERWIVGPSPTLEEDFACIAATRADTVETTVYNAGEALHDPANTGFLREDSVLFVVMLTDEDTWDDDLATRVEIRSRILDAVGGDLGRIVVLGIAGDQGVFEEPKTVCYGPYGGAAPGRRISSIVYAFRNQGIMQDICAENLAAAFAAALDDVVTTCEQFEPEG
jgi:hypothetical protein